MAKQKNNTQESVDQQNEAIDQSIETVDQVTVEATTEEKMVADAVNAADPIAALTEVKSATGVSDILVTIISTYIALSNALGADAPATQHALENVKSFKSTVVKAPKAKKEPKVKAFNEISALRKIINEYGDVKALLDNVEVSDELKAAITAYTTLAEIPGIDQAVLDHTYAQLVNFGKKGTRSTGPRASFYVKAGDTVYTTLCGALDASGIKKGMLSSPNSDGKVKDLQDVAWRSIRPKLLKGESVVYNEVEYSATEPTVDAVSVVSKFKPIEKPVEA